MHRFLVTVTLLVIVVAITNFGISQNTEDTRVREQAMLQQFEAREGFLPNALVLMSEQPGVLTGFMHYGNQIFQGGPLSERERYLVALSAACALKSIHCMRAHTLRAAKAGASHEEILQTLLIAGMISNTSALQIAKDATEEIR